MASLTNVSLAAVELAADPMLMGQVRGVTGGRIPRPPKRAVVTENYLAKNAEYEFLLTSLSIPFATSPQLVRLASSRAVPSHPLHLLTMKVIATILMALALATTSHGVMGAMLPAGWTQGA